MGPVELAQAVEARLGRLVFAPVSQADLAVEGRIEVKGTGFSASLQVSDREGKMLGERQLESSNPDCRAMDRALVLVASLLIDPEAFPEPPAEVAPAKHPKPVVTSSAAPSRLDEPSLPLWGSLGVAGALGFGPLPSVSPGALISFELGSEDGLRARASAVFGHRGTETEAGTAASLTRLAAGLGLCYAKLILDVSSLGVCGGPELGVTLADADGLAGPQDRAAFWFAGVLGLYGHIHLGAQFFLDPALELVVPLRGDRFTYVDGAGAERVLFEPSPAGLRLSLGLGYRFGP